jgi:outer membrane PBP1 activator LpoA protein
MTQRSGHAAFIFLCKVSLTRNPGYNLLSGRKRHRGKAMNIARHFAAGLISALIATPCFAQQQTVKIGLLVPLTGPFTPTGKQLTAGARLYMQQNGDTVAGKKIEIIRKDTGGIAPDVAKRLAQELVVAIVPTTDGDIAPGSRNSE